MLLNVICAACFFFFIFFKQNEQGIAIVFLITVCGDCPLALDHLKQKSIYALEAAHKNLSA